MRTLRHLVMIGITALALALTACSSSGGQPGASSGPGSATAGSAGGSGGAGNGGKSVRIGVSFYSDVIPLYIQMKQGIQDEAKKLGASVEFAYADNSAETQSNQINTFVTKGVDIILCSPVDAKALVPAYQHARQAGIPVISVANKVDDSKEDAYVGPDLVDQAARTMQRVVDAIDAKGDIMLITGPPQIAFVQLQKVGWKQVLDKNPGVKVATTLVDNDLSTSAAVDLATTGLASHRDVKAILASDDDIALGAIKAVQSAGIDFKSIYIAGWDGSPPAIKAIKAGTYDLTLSERGYTWGSIALRTAYDYANGKKPAQHRVNVPDQFIDQKNVNTLTAEQIR